MSEAATAPLTGKALLQKVKELSHLPRRETAKKMRILHDWQR